MKPSWSIAILSVFRSISCHHVTFKSSDMEFLIYICLALSCEFPLSISLDVSLSVSTLDFTVFSSSHANDADALKEAAIVQPTAIVNPFVTQHVYGFADFVTTIGNTVMIFSPSSIAVAGKFHLSFESNQDIFIFPQNLLGKKQPRLLPKHQQSKRSQWLRHWRRKS